MLLAMPAMAQDDELERGKQFYGGKDLFLAIKNFKEAYETDPSYQAGMNLAVAYQDYKEYDKAERIYK